MIFAIASHISSRPEETGEAGSQLQQLALTLTTEQ